MVADDLGPMAHGWSTEQADDEADDMRRLRDDGQWVEDGWVVNPHDHSRAMRTLSSGTIYERFMFAVSREYYDRFCMAQGDEDAERAIAKRLMDDAERYWSTYLQQNQEAAAWRPSSSAGNFREDTIDRAPAHRASEKTGRRWRRRKGS